MRQVRIARTLLRTFGWKGLVRRSCHEVRRRVGFFLPAPKQLLQQRGRDGPRVYFYRGDLSTLPSARLQRLVERGRKVMAGSYEAFGFEWRTLPRNEVEWRKHVDRLYEFPMIQWWRIDQLPRAADIKDIWEPARFAWVYDLVRAYDVTREQVYADAFHLQLASWERANPPFRGPHWSCGQETAIRAIAILHAMDSLPAPTADWEGAQGRVTKILGWSGERIADGIGYGLSQRNNHGISESAGLVHIGLRLDGLHPDARRWIRRGMRLLEEQIRDQFSSDGWYAQHSFTYMRVALEQALLAQHVLRLHGQTLSQDALELLRASVELLLRLVNAHDGHVPNHGANDGGRIAPLSTAEYRDFRPILTEAALILGLPLPADVPADAEIVAWLGDVGPQVAPARRDGAWTGISGWACARIEGTQVFLRAGSYKHRPSHLDALHLDVAFGPAEAIVDPGTFAYNAQPPWNNGLTSAVVHNGPVVDDAEPGQRGPRFLWYSWPSACLLEVVWVPGAARFVAELAGRVRREVRVTSNRVEVRDCVLDSHAAVLQVTWLLNPLGPPPEILVPNAEVERVEAAEGSVSGWFSPTYGLRLRSAAVRARKARSAGVLEVSTVIAPRL